MKNPQGPFIAIGASKYTKRKFDFFQFINVEGMGF